MRTLLENNTGPSSNGDAFLTEEGTRGRAHEGLTGWLGLCSLFTGHVPLLCTMHGHARCAQNA